MPISLPHEIDKEAPLMVATRIVQLLELSGRSRVVLTKQDDPDGRTIRVQKWTYQSKEMGRVNYACIVYKDGKVWDRAELSININLVTKIMREMYGQLFRQVVDYKEPKATANGSA